ncbi:hypothetical protein QYF61_027709 [Mycteria americana]|uniref:B30.2/SPRY domain-containing protein n=1 Tax=Mycteria americana TaxID=33587 RepID=A0AAN7NAI5_MYCAM|nr:hypothetical protein QYF61_027709 [Mycteria americana]
MVAVDVTLDADTAHPRLEISDDGKSVKDTGIIRKVPSKEKRFDSHTFVLAKEGYTSGRHYWEVDVGKRRSWALGIAWESVTSKGTVTPSPKNGFWVIGFADEQEYWAHSDPWTRLSVSGKLQKTGVFLDMSAKQLLFYNVCKKAAVYTFSIGDGTSQEGKFIPFFSTGRAAAKPDTVPLKIVQGFHYDLQSRLRRPILYSQGSDRSVMRLLPSLCLLNKAKQGEDRSVFVTSSGNF